MCQHFGHCEQFALFDVDADNKTILKTTMVVPPPHEPGLLPTWLQEQGADVIIAGGMGSRAQELFLGKGIHVVTGASSEAPGKGGGRLPQRRPEDGRPMSAITDPGRSRAFDAACSPGDVFDQGGGQAPGGAALLRAGPPGCRHRKVQSGSGVEHPAARLPVHFEGCGRSGRSVPAPSPSAS